MSFNARSLFGFSLALLATVASATPFTKTLNTRDSTACATGLHLMIAGGCDMPCPSDVPGYLNTTIAAITTAFPGSDTYYVPYTDSTKQADVSTPLMIAAANEYFAACPNTPVVFVGYSLGAIITMGTLCGGLSASNTGNVLAAIAYGDETFAYPTSYDAGTCRNIAPIYARNNTAACDTYAPILRSYCDAQDPACCTGGTNIAYHFTYPELYNADAVAFIQGKYANRTATATTSTTTAAQTSSVLFPATGASTKTELASVTSAASSSTTASSAASTTAASTTTTASSSSTASTTSTSSSTSTTSSKATTITSSSSTSTLPVPSSTSVSGYTGTGAAVPLALPTGMPALVGAVAIAAFMF